MRGKIVFETVSNEVGRVIGVHSGYGNNKQEADEGERHVHDVDVGSKLKQVVVKIKAERNKAMCNC
jgi:hypothetical protein